MFDANIVTAFCAVLGVIGGFWVWFNNIVKSRMPDVDFKISSVHSAKIFRVTLKPTRGQFVYHFEKIVADRPLFEGYQGIDVLGRGKFQLCNELNKDSLDKVIPSRYQQLENEPYLEFLIDLRDYKQSIYSIRLLCKSEHFPFRWGKRVDIPLG